MTVKDSSHNAPRLPTPKLREAAENALQSGDLESASTLAIELRERDNLGPWGKALLGRIAVATGRADEALSWLTQSAQELPDEGVIKVELAAAYALQRKWKTAAGMLEKALRIRADIPDLHVRHATYLSNSGQSVEVDAALNRALALDPKNSATLTFVGERHLAQGRLAQAKAALEKAIESDAGNTVALSNLALVFERQGDLEAALAVLDRLLEIDSKDKSAMHRKGLIQLSLGKLEEGWKCYARRLKNKSYLSWQNAVRVPYWTGEEIDGKSLLVWADQGLGEQILAASLVPEAANRADYTTLACDPRLVPLLQRSFPDIAVVSLEATRNDGEGLGPVDIQASLSEMGAVLRPDYSSFPPAKPFLSPDIEKVKRLRERIKGESEKPLIGISWRSANPQAGVEKSTDLIAHWRPILAQSDLHFVSLQYGSVNEDLEAVQNALDVEVTTIPDIDFEQDLDGFAALVGAMDMVVSISNTTVHVAGGLGVPAKAILPQAYGRPWYWFTTGRATPWYSGVDLYRADANWSAAVTHVAQDLSEWKQT